MFLIIYWGLSMNETTNIGAESRSVVDARELHAALEVGGDFATWVRGRIEEYGFVEGEDYSLALGDGSDGPTSKPGIEYLLTTDMAKELVMLENNLRGRQVRKHSSDTEKELLAGMSRPVEFPALPRYTVDELRESQLRAFKDLKPMFDHYLASNSWERALRREYLFAWMAYLGVDANHPLHEAVSADDAERSMKEMKKVGRAAWLRALPVPASPPSDRVDAPLYLGKATMKGPIWAPRPDLRGVV